MNNYGTATQQKYCPAITKNKIDRHVLTLRVKKQIAEEYNTILFVTKTVTKRTQRKNKHVLYMEKYLK